MFFLFMYDISVSICVYITTTVVVGQPAEVDSAVK